MDYIRKTGVEIVVGWQANIDFLVRESRGFREGDLVPLGRIDGFLSMNHPWLVYEVGGP
jgi:hypothetical protein